MFESVAPPDPAERLRNAAFIPMAAFLFALVYFSLYPLLERVPAALFWFVDAVALIGTIGGALAIIRVVRCEKLRGRAVGWLAFALIAELLCAYLFLSLTFPWM